MVFVCASGGGHRASMFTMAMLQYADSTCGGKLMKQTVLMTGASGGMLGVAYFRELYYQNYLQQNKINLNDKKYTYSDGTTIYFEQSSGLTENNLTAVPITKDEVLLKVVDQAQVQTNVYIERGKSSGLESIQRLGEVDNLGDMINYGYGFFSVVNKQNGF